jgi:hypothetical protein
VSCRSQWVRRAAGPGSSIFKSHLHPGEINVEEDKALHGLMVAAAAFC